MISKKKLCYIVIPSMIAVTAASVESINTEMSPNTIVAAQSSPDGRYVVTTNKRHTAVLWDFKHNAAKLLSQHVSQYSIHFIKGSHDIEWKDNISYRRHVQHIGRFF